MSLQTDDDDIPGWVRIGVIVVLLALLALVASCAPTDSAPTYVSPVTVEEHLLPDGTLCAVAWTHSGYGARPMAGGLSCDWAHAETPDVRLPTAAQAYITAEGEPAWRQ